MKRNFFDLLRNMKSDFFGQEQFPGMRPQEHLTSNDQGGDVIILEPTAKVTTSDDASLKSQPAAKGVESTAPETRYFEIDDGDKSRKIAYTISGDLDAENVLLCLPGLLETKKTFLVIHAYFLKFKNCKVVSIDLSGRGESDHLDDVDTYKMSLYLSDISQLIRGIILTNDKAHLKLTILGTSMGGVLAMYLTKIFGKKIFEIILNDIALTVNWTSLYSLYKSMKNDVGFREARQLAKDLKVDERAISGVQSPGHFDLSFRADVWGMNFHEALEGYKGRVGLIYGGESKICTRQRVEEAKSVIPNLSTLEVADSGHPAPFNLLVCGFIQSEMGV
jgi:pimeloyl-ACP methyl ester carboxylesterase